MFNLVLIYFINYRFKVKFFNEIEKNMIFVQILLFCIFLIPVIFYTHHWEKIISGKN